MAANKIYKQVIEPQPPKARRYIRVGKMYEDIKDRLKLQIFNDDRSFDRKIEQKELNRPGLALSGFVEVFTYWRVQVMGNTEIGYLNTLHGKKRIEAISNVLSFELPCIVITNNNRIPDELVKIAN
ncbi:hypothetical protein DRI50_09920, partial [candidate division KSB1 bacterium]